VQHYKYTKLTVMCLEPREFGVKDIRSAVEYLKTVPGALEEGTLIGLMATTIVPAGTFILQAEPILPLKQIAGKTPRQVWDAFDQRVTEQRRDLILRALPEGSDLSNDMLVIPPGWRPPPRSRRR
jgi:hypothetical protein